MVSAANLTRIFPEVTKHYWQFKRWLMKMNTSRQTTTPTIIGLWGCPHLRKVKEFRRWGVSNIFFFPESSVTLAAWIPASMTTLALAMAPFASALCQKFNCRNVTFVGSLFCFIGITLSSLAPNVETLFVTFGLLTGLGVGLSTTPGIILVARYFDKRRGIANAFCLSGKNYWCLN